MGRLLGLLGDVAGVFLEEMQLSDTLSVSSVILSSLTTDGDAWGLRVSDWTSGTSRASFTVDVDATIQGSLNAHAVFIDSDLVCENFDVHVQHDTQVTGENVTGVETQTMRCKTINVLVDGELQGGTASAVYGIRMRNFHTSASTNLEVNGDISYGTTASYGIKLEGLWGFFNLRSSGSNLNSSSFTIKKKKKK